MPSVQAEFIYISDNVTLGSGNDIYFDINNARSRAYTIYNQVAGFSLKLTYYSPTTNNPLYAGVGNTANSWCSSAVLYNQIPLSDDCIMCLVKSVNTSAFPVYANLRIPTMTQGQTLNIRDKNGYLNLTQISLFPSNGDAIDDVDTYVTYNTSNLKIKYIYAGTGFYGNLISI